MKLAVLLFSFSLLLPKFLFSAVFPVTNTADSGTGSLRDAIIQANATGAADVITFNIPAAGVKTISLLSALPAIIAPLTIDGSSDPNYLTQPLIEVNGNNVVNHVFEFAAGAANSEINALIINRALIRGIYVNADDFRLRASYIGTDPTGSISQSNGTYGIDIRSGRDAIIGGNGANEGNLISGNTLGTGLYIGNGAVKALILGNLIGTDINGTAALPNASGVSCNGDSVLLGESSLNGRNIISGNDNGAFMNGGHGTAYNNYIGLDITGATALPNTGVGMLVRGDSTIVGGPNALESNVISGNGSVGLSLSHFATIGTKIMGNFIGTDYTDTVGIGNGTVGLVLNGGCIEVTVGGNNPGEGNVISANQTGGMTVNTGNYNYILGNYIGTDITGTVALANQRNGISLNSATNIFIGDGTAGGANVISANQWMGISLNGNSDSMRVKYNYIGTDPGGLLNLGNGDYGISINGGASDAEVGGSLPGEGNFIANNGDGGVLVNYVGSIRNEILGNSIYDHTGLGIFLSTGSNNAQAAPDLTGYTAGVGTSTFFGTFTSTPNTNFRLEFFSSPTSNQGKTYLGATFITTDAAGFYALAELLPVTISAAEPVITATATDPDGNTSEFGVEIILATEILDFRIEEEDPGNIKLFWETSFPLSPLTYEIQQQDTAGNFYRLGEQKDYTIAGNQYAYEFPLRELRPANYTFRLKQIGENATHSYSRILNYEYAFDQAIHLHYPNPLSAENQIELITAQSQEIEVRLFDLQGKTSLRLYEGSAKGNELLQIPCQKLEALSPGLYILELKGNLFTKQQKIVLK